VTALPRRPLTIGELLDAAVELVRGRAWPLLAVSLVLALGEQAALYPLRLALDFDLVQGPGQSFEDAIGPMWLLFTAGLTFEAAIVAFLGVSAGTAAAADLSDTPTRPAGVLKLRLAHASMLFVAPLSSALLFTGLLALAGTFSLGGGLAFLMGLLILLIWLVTYSLLGLTGAVIGLERRGPFGALGRSAGMGFRVGMRSIRVRILGLLGWLLLRTGFYIGLLSLLDYVPLQKTGAFVLITVGVVIANAASYLFLAALDAVALAEVRFRSEGLDIWLSRAAQHGTLEPGSVAAVK
jgi:hypothetical protein